MPPLAERKPPLKSGSYSSVLQRHPEVQLAVRGDADGGRGLEADGAIHVRRCRGVDQAHDADQTVGAGVGDGVGETYPPSVAVSIFSSKSPAVVSSPTAEYVSVNAEEGESVLWKRRISAFMR